MRRRDFTKLALAGGAASIVFSGAARTLPAPGGGAGWFAQPISPTENAAKNSFFIWLIPRLVDSDLPQFNHTKPTQSQLYLLLESQYARVLSQIRTTAQARFKLQTGLLIDTATAAR